MRHPASPEISGFFRSWHVLPTFLRSRLMAVRHACRDTAPAENPCAACQSDFSVDRRFFVDTGLAQQTGREACREKVGPYVEITVAGGAIRKQKTSKYDTK